MSRQLQSSDWCGGLKSIGAVLAIAAASLPSGAVTLSDGFTDLDRDNDSVTDDGASSAVASPDGFAWYRYGDTAGGSPRPVLTTGDDSAGIGSGGALFVSASGSNEEFMAPLGQTITLGTDVGSTVSLTMDVRYNNTGGAAPADGTFRFGLYQDTNGKLATHEAGWGAGDGDFDDSSSGPTVGDRGVWGRLASGSAALNNSGRVILEGTADSILGGTGSDGRSFGGNEDMLVLSSGSDIYRLTILITRTAVGMDIALTADNLTTVADDSYTIGGSIDVSDGGNNVVIDSFDFLAVTSSVGNDYVIDNVSVFSSVPEPSSLCLAALGGALVLVRRR